MCILCDELGAERCETHGHSPEWMFEIGGDPEQGQEACSVCGADAEQMAADAARNEQVRAENERALVSTAGPLF